MWHSNWRARIWAQVGRPWDLVVVGGGISGAGVLRLATHMGLRALLVEEKDFSWGTSSRSTKLVHGGLRYLGQGQFGVTRESVHEREHLTKEAPGLVDELGFLVPMYEGASPNRRSFAAGLAVYDYFARKWDHRYCSADDFLMLAPHIRSRQLQGGFCYYDSVTDDSRLVLRVIREAVQSGATALNYAVAEQLVFDKGGQVSGLLLRDVITGRSAELAAKVVVNSTGAWADRLRKQVGGQARIRPSRGSHLIFPAWKLPVAQAVTLVHPDDRRFVYALPWEGSTVAGTTDLDHHQALDEEPSVTREEVTYLLKALDLAFPSLRLTPGDVASSFSGVRPIVGSGKGDPSKESRAHVVLVENGLVTIAGGKLTTFRRMAQDTLKAVSRLLPGCPDVARGVPMLEPVGTELPGADALDPAQCRRLWGRYGAEAPMLVQSVPAEELRTIEGGPSLWAELRWAAREEGVVHLDDLLLRRVRIGLLLPRGAQPIMERIRATVQTELGWDDGRWETEAARYAEIWQRSYSLPAESLC
jgi:glycerol-3-phosphate dehydrogenase